MARNVTFQVLRGTQASIPTLSLGEMYFATDTGNLWVGGVSGSVQIGGTSLLLDYEELLAQARFDVGNSGFTLGGS